MDIVRSSVIDALRVEVRDVDWVLVRVTVYDPEWVSDAVTSRDGDEVSESDRSVVVVRVSERVPELDVVNDVVADGVRERRVPVSVSV